MDYNSDIPSIIAMCTLEEEVVMIFHWKEEIGFCICLKMGSNGLACAYSNGMCIMIGFFSSFVSTNRSDVWNALHVCFDLWWLLQYVGNRNAYVLFQILYESPIMSYIKTRIVSFLAWKMGIKCPLGWWITKLRILFNVTVQKDPFQMSLSSSDETLVEFLKGANIVFPLLRAITLGSKLIVPIFVKRLCV